MSSSLNMATSCVMQQSATEYSPKSHLFWLPSG